MKRAMVVLVILSFFSLPLMAQGAPKEDVSYVLDPPADPVLDPLQQLLTAAGMLTEWVNATVAAGQATGMTVTSPDMTSPTDFMTLIDYVYRLLSWVFQQYTVSRQ